MADAPAYDQTVTSQTLVGEAGFTEQQVAPQIAPSITHLKAQIAAGRPWASALFEAVGMWTASLETLESDEIVYLVGGEAFDWLLLAERLLRSVPYGIEDDERHGLLFTGQLPRGTSVAEFKEALGPIKFRAHLNYFYGVVVEEALWLAVEQDVLKERGMGGLDQPKRLMDTVCERLYRADHGSLLRRFQRERGDRYTVKLKLRDLKEFTYWLFKLRVGRSDSSRTASDTHKGLRMLSDLRGGIDDLPFEAGIPGLSVRI
jgi:hypothetical protein